MFPCEHLFIQLSESVQKLSLDLKNADTIVYALYHFPITASYLT